MLSITWLSYTMKVFLIRAIWNGIVAGFKTTFDSLGNLFGFFIDIVKATGTALKGAFTLDFDDVKDWQIMRQRTEIWLKPS